MVGPSVYRKLPSISAAVAKSMSRPNSARTSVKLRSLLLWMKKVRHDGGSTDRLYPSRSAARAPTGYEKASRGETVDLLLARRNTRATELAYAVSSVTEFGFHNAGPLDEIYAGTIGSAPLGLNRSNRIPKSITA